MQENQQIRTFPFCQGQLSFPIHPVTFKLDSGIRNESIMVNPNFNAYDTKIST